MEELGPAPEDMGLTPEETAPSKEQIGTMFEEQVKTDLIEKDRGVIALDKSRLFVIASNFKNPIQSYAVKDIIYASFNPTAENPSRPSHMTGMAMVDHHGEESGWIL